WPNGFGKNWNLNAPVFAKSWCTKHPLRGASIAANKKQRLGQHGSWSNLQINRVAFQLVVKSGSLNPEQFGCFFLVPAAFGERLENCVPLQVVESLHALAGQPAEFDSLQRRWQLYFCGQLLYPDDALPRQHHGVFDGVLQFANIS